MKKENLIKVVLPVVALAFVFSGCGNNEEVQNKENNNVEVSQKNDRGRGNANNQGNQNNLKEEYKVDSSDMVNSERLIEGMEKEEISADEKNGLIQMREEEKLAQDVYQTLFNKWDQKIFTNIAGSEGTHTESIRVLLEKYNIEDPVKSKDIGVFTLPEMQKLYDDLVANGNESLEQAFQVGATVEDLDIKDLQDLLETTDNEDVQTVYQNLMKGSRNHLRAFMKQVERNGGEYSPQYISQEDFEQIISGEQERGNVDGQGKRNGIQQQKGSGGGNGSGDGNGIGSQDGSGSGTGGGRNQM
ncbi:MAG: DUF2202 domain-containing protein [Candidatus Moranbacteria bacterium]|nr:DUF2202 domain-containing protein [Candidatus Moranbacteria bacterium]